MIAVSISEVNLVKDYVELKNNNSVKINLRGWKIIDTTPTNQKRHEFIFQKDFFLQPDATIKIWSSVGNNDTNNIYQNRRAKIWNNPGDTAELYDSHGNLVDKKSIGNPPKGGRGGGAKPPVPPKPPAPAKITISGYVNDVVCKQPIQNAKLVFQVLKGQKETETNTDENGHYETELTGGRDYTVTISAKDYDDLSDTINTKAGKDITKNFKLEPNLEIELDVDSAEVKFTRKDDNKINATQELKDKLVVDFNTNYTFTVKVLIKKGMTNKIKAILIENGVTNKDSRESNVCRISDADKNIIFTFNPIKQKWDWVVLGAFWYVNRGKTKKQLEKTYGYSLDLQGNYGNNKFNLNPPFELGKIVVKVNGEKLSYLVQYDLLLDGWWKALTAASALSIAAAFQPWLILAAAAAWAAFAMLNEQKNIALNSARDPPQFDKNYKKLVRLTLNLKTHDTTQRVKQIAHIQKSILTSRDRLYSAYIKRNKKLAKRHFKRTVALLNKYEANAKFISKQLRNSIKILKKYKNYINVEAVAQFRNAIRQKILPQSAIINTIKRFGVSEKNAYAVVRALMGKKFSNKDLSLSLQLNKLPKLVDRFNKLSVNNIKKEIKWYL